MQTHPNTVNRDSHFLKFYELQPQCNHVLEMMVPHGLEVLKEANTYFVAALHKPQ